jgi:hypothetical protein
LQARGQTKERMPLWMTRTHKGIRSAASLLSGDRAAAASCRGALLVTYRRDFETVGRQASEKGLLTQASDSSTRHLFQSDRVVSGSQRLIMLAPRPIICFVKCLRIRQSK